MDITGVEVIRHPSVAQEVVTGEKIELTYSDTLRVNTSFGFRGPKQNVTLYGAIGNRKAVIGFDEIIHGEASIELPESRADFTPCQRSVNIPITDAISPGTDYDLYCKIKEYSEAGAPEVADVIDIVGIPPKYELLEETIYPYAYVYDGDAETSTFTFKSDPFTPAKWIAGKLASAVENEVRKDGGRVMQMRVYVDKTPLLWTDWRIEVVGVPPKGTTGVAASVGIAWWAIAILAALAIALIIVITWSVKTIVSTFKRKPGLEEVKPAWKRETLIQTIQDAEEYWERTPTPPETLEGMSEEELREYLDKIAKEEVPAVSWWPLAVGAGIAVVGIGVALATKKKE